MAETNSLVIIISVKGNNFYTSFKTDKEELLFFKSLTLLLIKTSRQQLIKHLIIQHSAIILSTSLFGYKINDLEKLAELE